MKTALFLPALPWSSEPLSADWETGAPREELTAESVETLIERARRRIRENNAKRVAGRGWAK